jgi:hypothetical protein
VVLLVLWLTALSVSSGATDVPRETRVHWTMLDSIERLPAEKQRELRSATEIPQITIIRRSEFPLITKANPPAAGEAIRRSKIVLVNPASQGIRFSWAEKRDFEKGRADYALLVYYPTLVRDEIRLSVEYPILGRDFDSYFAAAAEARRKGSLAADGQLLVTVDYSGRKWMLTVEDWRRGLFSSEDKEWLKAAVDGRLKTALNLVLTAGFGLPELQMACELVALPMLGDYERSFRSADELIRPRGKPDCDFDAWFGEPCSLEQQMEFKVRKNPQVAPPAP